MTFFLGFDGGGTKTECVLVDGEGEVLGRAQNGPSNPLRAGFFKACMSLGAAADAVLARKHIRAVDIHGIFAGLGGAGLPRTVKQMTAFFVRSFPSASVRVTSDLELSLAAAVGDGPGVVLVAGTGSAAYGRNARGKTARSGGRGPWYSDEGSAFQIGRKAVRAVVLAEEQRGPATSLSEKLMDFLDCQNWAGLTDRVIKNPDEVFPKVYPLVVHAAARGDAVSVGLLERAAEELSALAVSVVRQLGMEGEEFRLAKTGGVFGRSAILDPAVDAALASVLPGTRLEYLEGSQALAAAKLAIRESNGMEATA
jgi:N-acetylglucosamine kinase-like BadF-type ATPase